MRVLHFIPVYVPAWQYGGPVLSVSRLCEALVSLGLEVRVITTTVGIPKHLSASLGFPEDVNGVQVYYYPPDKNSPFIASRQLEVDLDSHLKWADIVHISSIWQPLGLAVQRSAYRHKIPFIQSPRGALGPYSWIHGWYKKLPYFFLFERPLLQLAATIHCTSLQEANEMKWLRLKPSFNIIPNSINLDHFFCNPRLGLDWRDQHHIDKHSLLFLVAGRLHHKKGLDLLPSVLEPFRAYSWHLAFIGDDSDGTASELKRLFLHHGLSERCTWLPSVPSSSLHLPLNAADFLLLPSRHENFGNIVLEALACGAGVVTTPRVGVTEMLKTCPGVYLARRRKSNWTHLIQHVLHEVRPGFSSESWVKQAFSQTSIARSALTLYESIL